MGGAVDAERQPGDDHQPGPAQVAGEGAGVLQPLRGRVAAADDRDRVGGEQLDPALDVEQRRRVGGLEQRRRIARIAEHQHVAPARRVGRTAVEPGEGGGEQGGELRRLGRQRRGRGRRRPAAGAPRSRRRARACGEPNSASRRRAASRPTPGVPTRRSHAASSSRSIMARAAAVREAGRRACAVAAGPPRSGLREQVAGRDRLARPTGSARTTCARTRGTRTARRGARPGSLIRVSMRPVSVGSTTTLPWR